MRIYTEEDRASITRMMLDGGYWGVRDLIDEMTDADIYKYFGYWISTEEDDE